MLTRPYTEVECAIGGLIMILMLRLMIFALIIYLIYKTVKFIMDPKRKLESSHEQKKYFFYDVPDNIRKNFLVTHKGVLFEGKNTWAPLIVHLRSCLFLYGPEIMTCCKAYPMKTLSLLKMKSCSDIRMPRSTGKARLRNCSIKIETIKTNNR